MIWRIRFKVLGSHVHCGLFVAPEANQTFAKCGDFVVRVGLEFESLARAFSGADLISDDPNVGLADAYVMGTNRPRPQREDGDVERG